VIHHLVPENGESLSLLERETFVLPQPTQQEPTYIFRHALIQEVAYNRQLQSHRRTTHAAIGEALETIYAERLDELVGELAFHFGHSDRKDKALYWLVRAGDRARALFANTEALAQYRAALELATEPVGDLDAAALLERIGDIQTLVGRYDEAIGSLRAALVRRSPGVGSFSARIHRRLGATLVLKGAYEEAAGEFAAGLAALAEPDDQEVARIELHVGQLHYRRGDFAAARMALERAVELGSRAALDDLVALGLKELGNVAVDTGDLTLAAEYYRRSHALFERLEDIIGLADTHNNLGIIYRRTGRWAEALAEYDASLALRQRTGHLMGVALCYNNIAEVHRTRGEPALAVPAYLQAIETWEGIGHALWVGMALVGLGAARVALGDIDQGGADLLEAEARFATLGSTIYLPELFRYLAEAGLAAGDIESAEVAANRSLDYARAGSARHQEAATLRVIAEINIARGETVAARALLEISHATLTKLGDVLELARTEAVLKRLDGLER
jgi:tetratricopeptide (TPR) repeat protein